MVISALFYPVAREVISAYKDQFGGKILVDIPNPINDGYDDLVTPLGTSTAEELARIAPGARWIRPSTLPLRGC